MSRISVVPTSLLAAAVFFLACGCDLKPLPQSDQHKTPATVKELGDSKMSDKTAKVTKTDAEWQKTLTPAQYRILRQKGTEPAYSGKYDEFFAKGDYLCAACGNELFTSQAKYNSGCGWPAFSATAQKGNVDLTEDSSLDMNRTEVTCSRCGGHLGHVFKDGPKPTGLRYCINSEALDFEESSPSDK